MARNPKSRRKRSKTTRKPSRSRNPSGGSRTSQTRGWDSLATWYDGMVGGSGSHHHTKLAIPLALDLLALEKGQSLLDIGCGQGVLAPHVIRQGVEYVGIDASKKLIERAKARHGNANFVVADSRRLHKTPELRDRKFDKAVFLLSIQDMNPLNEIFISLAQLLKPKAEIVIVMLHPAFRIPRQSGWGFDEKRKLQYRRVDSYLSELKVPLKSYAAQQKGAAAKYGRGGGVSISFHRPLSAYVNELGKIGFAVDKMVEVPTFKEVNRGVENAKAINRANKEIPLFVGLRGKKC